MSAKLPSAAARLILDRLDDRIVPTVVFRPTFGAETITAGSGYHALTSPPLELVFAGGYWNTANGQADRAAMIAATRTLVNGPYLSGLAQYGGDGKATLGGTWTEANGLANKFGDGDIQGLLTRVINNQSSPIPRPTTPAHTPLYIVITPPGVSSSGGGAGYNTTFDYRWTTSAWPFTIAHHADMHTLWVGNTATATGHVNMDEFGGVLSHEIVEAMSDPDGKGIHVTRPGNLPKNVGGDNQIGDLEADARRYGYNLNGLRVQPYWSARDNAFIVPDGNRQNFYLDPIWTTKDAAGNANFTGKYDLTVSGDQLGGSYNDAIALNASANDSRGTGATMNGESVNFDAGKIRAVNVNTGNGANAVNVNYVEAGMNPGGTSVSVNGTGGRDTVNVGGGYMSNIHGAVAVSNSSGTTALTVDGSKESPANVHVTNRGVQFAGDGAVTFNPGYAEANGTRHGVTRLDVLKSAATTVAVDSLEPLTMTYVNGVRQWPLSVLFQQSAQLNIKLPFGG